MIQRSTSTNVEWIAYLAPFSLPTWSLTLFVIIVVSLSIALIQWAHSKSMPEDHGSSPLESFGIILMSVFGSLCNQGKIYSCILKFILNLVRIVIILHPTIALNVTLLVSHSGMSPSKIDAVRFVHLVTYLTAVAILASYSAALISFSTIKSVHVPFTTMDGLIDDDTYKMGVVWNSADHLLLKVRKSVAYMFIYFFPRYSIFFIIKNGIAEL